MNDVIVSDHEAAMMRNELHRLVGAGLSAFSAIEFQFDMLFALIVDHPHLRQQLWARSQFSQQFDYVKAALKDAPADRVSLEEAKAIENLYPAIQRAKERRDELAHGQVIQQGHTGEMFFGPSFLRFTSRKSIEPRFRYDVAGLAAVVAEIDQTADVLGKLCFPSIKRQMHRSMEELHARAEDTP